MASLLYFKKGDFLIFLLKSNHLNIELLNNIKMFLAALQNTLGLNQTYQIPTENYTFTENGALSHALSDNTLEKEGRMGLFYKSVRGVKDTVLNTYLEKALNENVIDTILLSFYIRDCRGGKGEREIGRKCFKFLCNHEKGRPLITKLLNELSEYGRWDDLIILSEFDFMHEPVYKILYDRLILDLEQMNKNNPVSLCAKWMPTEGHKLDKNLKFTKYFIKYINGINPAMNKKTYRTTLLTPLRKYIDVVERKICAGLWHDIDYNKVPSCTMHKLKKAFKKHDAARFDKWVAGLKKGETKINAGQLYPHEIITDYIRMNKKDDLLEAQWDEIVNKSRGLGTFSRSIVVCDVSGSMLSGRGNVAPINVAVALGLLISELTNPPYKNTLITFSSSPQLVKLNDKDTLFQKIKQTKNMPWGYNTDLVAVFNLLLQSAVYHQLKPEELPDRLFILSDMQFDAACKNQQTNMSFIKSRFNKYGYNLPQIVFWNLNGEYNDYPVMVNEMGSILISGFSQSILKYLLDTRDITPWAIVENTLQNERYARLKNLLN